MRNKKKVFLVLISFLSMVFSYKAAFFIAETYFFDSLFYRKSLVFGYDDPWQKDNLTSKNPRYMDLNTLVDITKNEAILGVTDDQENYKITIIGDSFAYGTGVKIESRFPTLLEKKLNQIRPTTVHNLSHPGDSLIDNYAKFVLAKKTFRSNLYVITLLQNDLPFNISNSNTYPGEQALLSELNTLCPGENVPDIISTNPDITWSEILNVQYLPAYSEKYNNLCIANEIAKKIKDSGEKVLIFVYDGISDDVDLTNFDDDAQKNYYMTKTLSKTMEQNNLPILKCIFPPDFKPQTVSLKEGHPSSKNHQFYSDLLFKEISQNKMWGFK